MEICKEKGKQGLCCASPMKYSMGLWGNEELYSFSGLWWAPWGLGYCWSITGLEDGHSRCRDIGKAGDAAKHPHLHRPTPSQIYGFGAPAHSPNQLFPVVFSTSDFHNPTKPCLKWYFLGSLIYFSLCHSPKNCVVSSCQAADGQTPPKKLF